jgi:hypothetical protein
MTVEVPLIGIVILIFILHTILTHLINWGMRKAWEETAGESLIFLLCLLTIVEIVVGISLLHYYIK